MMKRRFQIFVSSTFEDLRDERQAAVEAILKAGHIPAGMELFTAGSESQLEVIQSWIDDCDIYMLILGGRYGSIEPLSELSYTEVEFRYARKVGKPFFSVVLSDLGRESRVKLHGTKVIEVDNVAKLKAFRDTVCSQMCSFFDSTKDIKLAVFETLFQIVNSKKLTGWVPATDVGPSNEIAAELTFALETNRGLLAEVDDLKRKIEGFPENSSSYQQLRKALRGQMVTLPAAFNEQDEDIEISVFRVAIFFADKLAVGVTNAANEGKLELFLRHNIAPTLVSYGLVESDKTTAKVLWTRLKLSKEGVKFLTWARLNQEKELVA